MKGTPDHPYCGFSGVVVRIFQHLNVSFYGIDILQDPVMREDLKLFSQWPTFPQIYMGGVFIGGCDILKNLYETQELHNMIKPYVSS